MEDVITVHSSVQVHNIVKCQDNLYSSQGKTFSTSVRDLGLEKISDVLQYYIPKKNVFQRIPGRESSLNLRGQKLLVFSSSHIKRTQRKCDFYQNEEIDLTRNLFYNL